MKRFIVCEGAFGVANLARCNIYSAHFNWRSVYGSDILHVGDLPVLCYVVGFAKSSSILEPTAVGNSGYHLKDVTMHPLSHEWERSLAALCVLAGVDIGQVRCWNDGMKVQTRQRSLPGPSAGPSMGPPAPGEFCC